MGKVFDEEVDRLLDTIARQEQFEDYEIEKLAQWVKGENYMGQVTPIAIKDDRKTLNVIVKTASKSEKLRDAAPISLAYERETSMYETVLPIFRKFEAERGIRNPGSNCAKCYAASVKDKHETLILENLKSDGFSVANRREDLDANHSKLVMENYAKFHAVSVAIKDQDLESFRTLRSLLKEDVYDTFLKRSKFFQMILARCEKVKNDLKLEDDEKLWKPFQNFVADTDFFLYNLAQYYDEKDSVIIHGDGWTNNMMFKYGDQNDPKKPTDVRLIDFQIVRIASPIIDLSYFVYGCCGKEVLDNIDDYLKIYHDSFCNHLKALGTDPRKAMSLSELKANWKRIGRFGIVMAMVLIQVRLTETEEAIDPAEYMESGNDINNLFSTEIGMIHEYNRRVLTLLNHAVDFGVI